jgi:hypothetical protein
MAFVMDVHRDQYLRDATLREEGIGLQGELAEGLLDKRAVSWVQDVSMDTPQGSSLAERCRSWIDATRRAAAEGRVAVSRVVVFDVTPTRVRGALLGERVASAQLVPPTPLEPALDIRTAGPDAFVWREGDPTDRVFVATLRTGMPKVPLEASSRSLGEPELPHQP